MTSNTMIRRMTPSNATLGKVSPSATTMIRADHTHVISTFHQFHAETSAWRKQAIVQTVCLALEVHAQLEEEIFYPAVREVAPDNEVLSQSVPEHDEMRRLIEKLREMRPEDADYERTFMDLMREVMHHAADEETVLLPIAEHRLADRLGEIGARMTKRRMELAAPKVPAMLWNTVQAMPMRGVWIAAGAVALLAFLMGRGAAARPDYATRHAN
ncbi:MAG: hemerythrin domain-containing protein [Burkholderiaceae bacterium]|nr:hemerythrin domain-containing protein [Burkholderiaceae bacterium]